MSLLFMDSFDHYVTADLTKKWNFGGTINSSAGRRGGGCMTVFNGGSQVAGKTLPGGAKSTLILGAAFQYSNLPGAVYELMRFRDGSTDQLTLALDTAGKLRVMRGGTLLATSTNMLAAGYHYLEFKATFHASAGAYEVRVDGQTVAGLQAVAVNTVQSANNSADGILLGTVAGNGLTQYYDDLYVCDSLGSTNNNFLGDVRIDAQFANADGANSAMTPSTGTTHYTLVDETAPNTTDYVESGTIGQRDTYGFTDISHTPVSVFGTQLNIAALKDDAGARSIKPVTRSGGTDYPGTAQALGTSQLYYMEVRETDPATSAAWTKAGVNAAEFGVECA